MKCAKCGAILTANTISNCPGCGRFREHQERRAIFWIGAFPALAIALLIWIVIAILWSR